MSGINLNEYEEVVTEYITDSINDSAMDILIDCTEDYLEKCGYDISRTSAIGRYLTSGMSGTAKRFFDNCWDAIETLGLSDMYSAYSTISDFAPDLITIISNANSLEMYRNADGTYTDEGKELLEEALYSFLSVTGNLLEYVPGGSLYNPTFDVLAVGISDSIDLAQRHYSNINYTNLMITLGLDRFDLTYGVEFKNLSNGIWQEAPSLETMAMAYKVTTNPSLFKELFGEYINWRIQYEFEIELRESGIDPQEYYDNVNGMYESTPEELEAIKRISAEQENNQKSEISDTDSSSSSTIIGDTNDNGSSDGDLTKTDDDENDSDPLSGDIIEQFPDIKNETNMPPKSRLTFWGHNHMLMFLSVDSRNSGDSFLENVENYSCGVERSENRHAVLYRAAAYRNAVVIVNS